jgi:hypothetical protein
MARSSSIAVVTISRPDSCSAASDPSSGTLIRGAPGWSKVNSSSRAAGSRSESSRRNASIPPW